MNCTNDEISWKCVSPPPSFTWMYISTVNWTFMYFKYTYDDVLWCYRLTPWLLEPRGSMPHSQGHSSSPYPELNLFLVFIPIYLISILMFSSHLCPSLPEGLSPIGLPVKILKVLLPSSFWLHELPISVLFCFEYRYDLGQVLQSWILFPVWSIFSLVFLVSFLRYKIY